MSYKSYDPEAADGRSKVKTPILTSIYNVFGVLWLLGGAIVVLVGMREPKLLAGSIGAAAIAVFMALVCFGISQVVMLIARIESNTRATDSSYQMVQLLKQIARNTTPPGTEPVDPSRG